MATLKKRKPKPKYPKTLKAFQTVTLYLVGECKDGILYALKKEDVK